MNTEAIRKLINQLTILESTGDKKFDDILNKIVDKKSIGKQWAAHYQTIIYKLSRSLPQNLTSDSILDAADIVDHLGNSNPLVQQLLSLDDADIALIVDCVSNYFYYKNGAGLGATDDDFSTDIHPSTSKVINKFSNSASAVEIKKFDIRKRQVEVSIENKSYLIQINDLVSYGGSDLYPDELSIISGPVTDEQELDNYLHNKYKKTLSEFLYELDRASKLNIFKKMFPDAGLD